MKTSYFIEFGFREIFINFQVCFYFVGKLEYFGSVMLLDKNSIEIDIECYLV